MYRIRRLTTLLGLLTVALTSVMCSSDDDAEQTGAASGAGSGGSAGSGDSAGKSGSTGGSTGSTGKGGSAGAGSGGATAGTSAGGVAGTDGTAGASGEPGGGEGGSAGHGGHGGAGEGGGNGGDGSAGEGGSHGDCVVGEVSSDATASNLSLFGTPVYFNGGEALPAGTYEVTYVDGCIRYGGGQGWTVNAYDAGGCCNWWLIGETTSELVVVLPGTIGYAVGSGAFAVFEECVAASQAAPPVEFEHAGGPLAIWLRDSPYSDNSAGEDGRNPKWRLRRLSDCL
jgi:hypothetical protein